MAMLDPATCSVHLQHGTTKLTLYLCAFANVTRSVASCDMQHRVLDGKRNVHMQQCVAVYAACSVDGGRVECGYAVLVLHHQHATV